MSKGAAAGIQRLQLLIGLWKAGNGEASSLPREADQL
jgi:hypothetical protein